jgi:hypothetical protein
MMNDEFVALRFLINPEIITAEAQRTQRIKTNKINIFYFRY